MNRNSIILPLLLVNMSVLFIVSVIVFKETKIPKYTYEDDKKNNLLPEE